MDGYEFNLLPTNQRAQYTWKHGTYLTAILKYIQLICSTLINSLLKSSKIQQPLVLKKLKDSNQKAVWFPMLRILKLIADNSPRLLLISNLR